MEGEKLRPMRCCQAQEKTSRQALASARMKDQLKKTLKLNLETFQTTSGLSRAAQECPERHHPQIGFAGYKRTATYTERLGIGCTMFQARCGAHVVEIEGGEVW